MDNLPSERPAVFCGCDKRGWIWSTQSRVMRSEGRVLTHWSVMDFSRWLLRKRAATYRLCGLTGFWEMSRWPYDRRCLGWVWREVDCTRFAMVTARGWSGGFWNRKKSQVPDFT